MPTKYRYAIKRSPKSDPQQYRVYRMESEAIGARQYQRISRETARQLVASVCRNYRVPVVDLAWANLGKWAAEWRPQESQRTSLIVLSTVKETAQDLLTITNSLTTFTTGYLMTAPSIRKPTARNLWRATSASSTLAGSSP